MKEIDEKDGKRCTLYDVSEEAKKADIEMPVLLDAELAGKLEPSPFLTSIGITFKQRLENLLSLVRSSIKPTKQDEKQFGVPFMVLKGPLVSESFVLVHVNIESKDGKPSITLSQISEIDEND
ncbi:hypothetical protein [Treponema primitia]|uniref:hypothetical protein n=1 Tax=Treponema primitia TaxID=88058 RepID=UPI00025553B6|nr:hypothetical protein [Treponema primitia]